MSGNVSVSINSLLRAIARFRHEALHNGGPALSSEGDEANECWSQHDLLSLLQHCLAESHVHPTAAKACVEILLVAFEAQQAANAVLVRPNGPHGERPVPACPGGLSPGPPQPLAPPGSRNSSRRSSSGHHRSDGAAGLFSRSSYGHTRAGVCHTTMDTFHRVTGTNAHEVSALTHHNAGQGHGAGKGNAPASLPSPTPQGVVEGIVTPPASSHTVDQTASCSTPDLTCEQGPPLPLCPCPHAAAAVAASAGQAMRCPHPLAAASSTASSFSALPTMSESAMSAACASAPGSAQTSCSQVAAELPPPGPEQQGTTSQSQVSITQQMHNLGIPGTVPAEVYEKLGGWDTLVAVVANYWSRLIRDPMFKPLFAGVNRSIYERKFSVFIGHSILGKLPYDARTLWLRHRHLIRDHDVGVDHVDHMLGHLVAALDDVGAPEGVKKDAAALYGEFRWVFERNVSFREEEGEAEHIGIVLQNIADDDSDEEEDDGDLRNGRPFPESASAFRYFDY